MLMSIFEFGKLTACRQICDCLLAGTVFLIRVHRARSRTPSSPTATAMALALPHPDTYPAYAFLEKGGDLQKVTIPWRDPEDGEVVVKVLACGVCGR